MKTGKYKEKLKEIRGEEKEKKTQKPEEAK